MKFTIPQNLEQQPFLCEETEQEDINLNHCKKCTNTNDYKNCWKKAIKKDIQFECWSNNAMKLEHEIICKNCQSRLTNIDEDRSLYYLKDYWIYCQSCHKISKYTENEAKEILKDRYEEINAMEFDNAIYLALKR